ncbi:GNAT family N-acetyltransferase [Actinophytocola glycyrrhizae]|uniref:GNAT family N-acetyltransferase n=1 Tax=Actinophytocola glycyrrhizae TaxID=2044873 RepID=A0ABV9SAE4_9PSEU
MTALTAEGLVLRGWEPGDAAALVEIYRDPAMLRWTRFPVTTAAEAEVWVANQQEGWAANTRHSFAVLDDERLVGCVALKRGIEVGYWTAAHARGRDVASRAVRALTAWAIGNGVTTLELRHQVDNEASCRVAEKSGFRLRETLPATPPWPLPGHLHLRTG